jgi:hypothetical protein
MAYTNKAIQDMFNHAADEDMTVTVFGYGESDPDYVGTNMAEALDHVLAQDETEAHFTATDGSTGWALMILDLDEDEQIADCSGWVERWMGAR